MAPPEQDSTPVAHVAKSLLHGTAAVLVLLLATRWSGYAIGFDAVVFSGIVFVFITIFHFIWWHPPAIGESSKDE